ncbi:MAG TPA: 30S ribosomal protein S16 [Candidatus Omnitrophota bacterium]|nr:30S ribosomal protein S16 [Candidatus Omnitrophota bacterium]
MEVSIRLQRIGKSAKNHRNFRIVAIKKAQKRDGGSLEILGSYEPYKKPAVISINQQRLDHWVKLGAQMSDTVRTLVKKTAKATK